ncbi:hypothetical protein D3C75_977360 [compost metagenome]
MQPLVVTHHPHEQEKALVQALTPTGHAFGVRFWIGGLVQAVGNDPGLFREVFQYVAGVQVVRRGRDDPVSTGQKTAHQRLIEFEQVLLPDDVRVVRDNTGFVQSTEEMHHVHERPGEVIIDHVGFGSQFTKLFEDAVGETGGCQLHIESGAMHLVRPERDDRRCRVGA